MAGFHFFGSGFNTYFSLNLFKIYHIDIVDIFLFTFLNPNSDIENCEHITNGDKIIAIRI